jgi:hypothetical protein
MRTRVQAWAVAFVSLVWSPSVVVMISRCPAARSNAIRPATLGIILGDGDLLVTAISSSLSSSSSATLQFGLLTMSNIALTTD